MNALRSLINNNPKIETSQMSLKSRMARQIVVCSYEILVSNKEDKQLTYTKCGYINLSKVDLH